MQLIIDIEVDNYEDAYAAILCKIANSLRHQQLIPESISPIHNLDGRVVGTYYFTNKTNKERSKNEEKNK